MIAIGCDHGGYQLKCRILQYLDETGVKYIDYGATSPQSVDYPVYAKAVCEAVASGECEKGILFCTTGQGMAISANKHPGIRAACCSDTRCALYTRKHNNINVLTLGEAIIGYGLAMDIVELFLKTPFDGGRHAERVAMYDDGGAC